MIKDEDDETGLPKVLHEGAYFEITRASLDNCLRIYYRIKRDWWFDKKVAWVVFSDFDDDSVYRAAERLLRVVREQERFNRKDSLIGKYPPKSLNKTGGDA